VAISTYPVIFLNQKMLLNIYFISDVDIMMLGDNLTADANRVKKPKLPKKKLLKKTTHK